jgi:type I restriction enzyme, S subunit
MKVKLGDIAEFINGGAWSDKEYVEIGIPVVKVTNLKNGTVDLSEVNYIPESSLDKYGRHTLYKGDLVIATVGSHPNLVASSAGRATIIPAIAEGTLLNQNALCIRSKSGNLHQGYLGYLGKSDTFQGYVKSVGRGAANQVRISLGLIKEFSFDLPPLSIQSEIASILSAYDDMIENNLKRIKLLEEKAFLRYKEIVRSEKMEEYFIENVCETIGGGTPSTGNPQFWADGNILWFSPTDLTKHNSFVLLDSEKKISELGLQKSSAKLVPPKTILMTSRASIGYFGLINKPVSTNQGFINIIPHKEFYRAYILFDLKSRKDEIIGNANGSTFLEISKSKFRQMKIRVPKNELVLMEFESEFDIIFNFIENLLKQNTHLRQARDILLPKLMSGEIEV